MQKNQQGLVIGGVAALIIAALLAWYFFGKEQRAPLSHREIATRVLAEYISSKKKPAHVLVISNPFSLMKGRAAEIYTYQRAGVDGLRKGFGSGTDLQLGFPKLKPQVVQNPGSVYVDPQTTTPLSFLVSGDDFDQLTREHPEAEVVVSLIGLPVDLASVQSWSRSGPPHYGLLLPDWRMIGNLGAVRKAFSSGKLLAAVVDKPGALPSTKPSSGSYRAEFDARFVLVTAENIEDIARAYPKIFSK